MKIKRNLLDCLNDIEVLKSKIKILPNCVLPRTKKQIARGLQCLNFRSSLLGSGQSKK